MLVRFFGLGLGGGGFDLVVVVSDIGFFCVGEIMVGEMGVEEYGGGGCLLLLFF